MLYDTSRVRRQDRLLTEQQAMDILLRGEYGFLAMASAEGGYGVPMNYAYEQGVIYLHCAMEGRKLQAIENDCRVTFCVVGTATPVAEQFTTTYESVLVQGRARIVETDEECRRALMLLVKKFAPQFEAQGVQAIERSLHRTAVVAIEAESISGKTKRVDM